MMEPSRGLSLGPESKQFRVPAYPRGQVAKDQRRSVPQAPGGMARSPSGIASARGMRHTPACSVQAARKVMVISAWHALIYANERLRLPAKTLVMLEVSFDRLPEDRFVSRAVRGHFDLIQHIPTQDALPSSGDRLDKGAVEGAIDLSIATVNQARYTGVQHTPREAHQVGRAEQIDGHAIIFRGGGEVSSCPAGAIWA